MKSGGKVILNAVNNSNSWIFRFQNIAGKIVMNGRIIGVNTTHRAKNATEMLKVLVKLAVHGF
jgi:hypothetical protein